MKIETERLVIRYFNENDGNDLYEYLSRPEVVKFEPYPPLTYRKAVEEARRRKDDHRFYAVSLKSGKVIGTLYLSRGEFNTWELGYVFHNDYWGNGYAYESAGALINYAFQNFGTRRMVAVCNPLNRRSWKLLERLGFRREGTLIQNVYFAKDETGNPIWQDTFEYGLLKSEWNNAVK